MSKLVQFTYDGRPHFGYRPVYVNPEDVSSVTSNLHSAGNPTMISMKNGEKHLVNESPDAVAQKIEKGEEPARR